MNKDTLTSLIRRVLIMLAGALGLHGVQDQATWEIGLSVLTFALNTWWSKRDHESMKSTGDTNFIGIKDVGRREADAVEEKEKELSLK